MNPDVVLPLVTSAAWLVLAGSALASHRLGWSRIIRMALAWIAIFGAVFLVIEWFLVAQGTTSAHL